MDEKEDGWKNDVRLKRLRSAFLGVTGRADRLIGRAGAASGQSSISSWRDRMRLVRADRTWTESGQRSPGNPSCMTGRGGRVRDRTQWSQRRVWSSVRSEVLESCLQDDRTRWWSPGPDAVVKQHRVRSSVRSLFFAFLQSDLRRDFSQSSYNSKRHK
jgi:hypothetical protein